MATKGSACMMLALAALALVASCDLPFGRRQNIHDPGGTWAIPSYGHSPVDGTTTFDSTPFLAWWEVSDAADYEVAMAGGDESLSTAMPVGVTEPEYTVPAASALADGTVVRWRVRALNGDGVAAPWSETHQFTVDLTPDYGTPSPADAASTYDLTPLLDWGDVTGSVSYEVAIAASSSPIENATAVEVTESRYQVPEALTAGAWRWRVRALDSGDTAAEWSAAWTFEVTTIEGYVYVSGGTFSMGSTDGEADEEPVHSVAVSSFLIGKHEVTQAEYETVRGSNPSGFAGDPSRPVECVSWYDAVAFCNSLSSLEGLDSCYTIEGTSVSCDFAKDGYRLPTEAEWELAARGGAESQGYTYSGSDTAADVAWYDDNASSTTHAVGTRVANELGVYDMSGNVWEWCWDWYGSYGSDTQTDPIGPTSGTYRVLRGGSWSNEESALRSAGRATGGPAVGGSNDGFRVVRRA